VGGPNDAQAQDLVGTPSRGTRSRLHKYNTVAKKQHTTWGGWARRGTRYCVKKKNKLSTKYF